jgi:hypothetical protein
MQKNSAEFSYKLESEMGNNSALQNVLGFSSEVVVTGGSNLIKGDFKQAGIHAALGLVAGSVLGFPGLLLVAANSFSQSQSGKGLMDAFQSEPAPHNRAESDAGRSSPAPKAKKKTTTAKRT